MSEAAQVSIVKRFVVDAIRRSQIGPMLAIELRENGKFASGELFYKLRAINPYRLFRIKYKYDKIVDLVTQIQITLKPAITAKSPKSYALAQDKDYTFKAGVDNNSLYGWITKKIKTPYWFNQHDFDFVVNKKNKGKQKEYRYPLTRPSARRGLAYILGKTVRENGYLLNTAPLVSREQEIKLFTRMSIEMEFYNYIGEQASANVEVVISELFN